LRADEDVPVSVGELDRKLSEDSAITHVAIVHCETTTGILNPIRAVGEVAKRHGKAYVVDAMSSFAGVPMDLEECHIDYLIASANKCLEGVPGIAFVICRRAMLLACADFSRSLSLDLVAQFLAFEKDGKFRFTPPTHVLVALHRALVELDIEGGIPARHLRYRQNHRALQDGMRRLGFQPYLEAELQSPIITAYRYPSQYEFHFKEFYERLAERGFVIYPGKLTEVDTFRIGNIGRIFEADILALLSAIREVAIEMGINVFPSTEQLHVNAN
jgi:2-aminoethylphosphonate-pyruvate transaminase